jgi:hypothetical protein
MQTFRVYLYQVTAWLDVVQSASVNCNCTFAEARVSCVLFAPFSPTKIPKIIIRRIKRREASHHTTHPSRVLKGKGLHQHPARSLPKKRRVTAPPRMADDATGSSAGAGHGGDRSRGIAHGPQYQVSLTSSVNRTIIAPDVYPQTTTQQCPAIAGLIQGPAGMSVLPPRPVYTTPVAVQPQLAPPPYYHVVQPRLAGQCPRMNVDACWLNSASGALISSHSF